MRRLWAIGICGILLFSSLSILSRASNENNTVIFPLENEDVDVSGAVQPPPKPLASGKVCILVEPAKYAPLLNELQMYKADLEFEGYTVEIRTDAWSDHIAVRNFLTNEWQSNGLVGCVIVGDLPYAEFELHNDFDEPGVYTSFPIDHYYTDLDGTWIDNNPVNGIYDDHTEPGPTDLEPEIWLGRITIDSAWEDEVRLISNYLNKTHEYRFGNISLPHTALLYVDDDWQASAPQWETALNYLYPDVTTESDYYVTNATDYAQRVQEGYEWIQVHCHANHESWRHAFMYGDGVKGSGGNFTSWNLSEDGQVSLFSNIFTCGSANFTVPDYLCGWYIFTENYGLCSVGSTKAGSMLQFTEFYEPLGNGDCIGDAFEYWFSIWAEGEPWGAGWENYARSWFYGMTILGDPTLSPTYEPPDFPPTIDVTSPNGSELWAGDSSQTITWSMSDLEDPDANLDVELYYSTTGLGGPWIYIDNANGVETYEWNPVPLVDSTNCYIRAIVTDTTALTDQDEDGPFTIDSTAPAPATNVHAELTDPTHVTIYWTPSPSPDIDRYEVYYRANVWDPSGDSYIAVPNVVTIGLGTSYQHNNTAGNNVNTYYWQVRTFDTVGQETRTVIQAKKVGAGFSIASNPSGWFLLGLSIEVSNTSVEYVLQTLMPTLDFVRLYRNGEWLSWSPYWPPSMNTLTDIYTGEGFWAHLNATDRWCIAGHVEDMVITLYEGWNLVAYPFADRQMISGDIITHLTANCPGFAGMMIQDPSAPYQIIYPTGAEVIQNSHGFWIYVTADTTWTVTNY